jgi:hypothetical protein
MFRRSSLGSVFRRANSVPVPQAVADIPVQQPRHIQPEPYRAAIQAVDEALYASSHTEVAAMGGEARSALGVLAEGLEEVPFEIGPTTIVEIRQLMARLPPGTTLELMDNAAKAWPPLRDKAFGTTSWFRYPNVGQRHQNRAVLATYNSLATTLLALVDEGTDRAPDLSAPTVQSFDDTDETDETARRSQAWQDFSGQLQQRLASLREQMPPRPSTEAGTDVLVAIQQLEQALAALSTAANGGLQGSAGRFDSARDAAQQAVGAFERLLY